MGTSATKNIAWQLPTIAGIYFLLHLIFNGFLGGYGIFRDEFYYLANSLRLDWGYVDHPPLAPLVLAGWSALFGNSALSLRFLPALAGAGTIVVAGLTARRLGGRTAAQAIAALSVAAVGVLMVLFGFYSMNAFEVLLWALAAYVAAGIFTDDKPQGWLLFGLLMGIGLQNKHTIVLFGGGLIVGLLLHRRDSFARRELWLGGLLALLIFLPNLLWEIRYGWPTVEFYANATLFKNIARAPADFLLQQILSVNPLLFPLWLIGLVYLLRRRELRPLAWSYLFPFLLLMAVGSSRPDRLAPAYIPLLAAGAVAVERYALRSNRRWITGAVAGLVVIGGLIVAPVGFPVLPPATTSAYASNFGLAEYEAGISAELPQFFADRFGWEEISGQVAAVYRALTPEEQAAAVIFTANYGEAGALEYYGPALGLPAVISGHNNYWLWGPGDASGEVVIFVGVPAEDIAALFASAQEVGRTACDWCLEGNRPLVVARGAKRPLEEIWPSTQFYQ
jgi:4-amino-4-deoxy-L-arabinose transferase-like glycosyltransferase